MMSPICSTKHKSRDNKRLKLTGAAILVSRGMKVLQAARQLSPAVSRLGCCMKIDVIGAYPVRADEPCHLVELLVRGLNGELPVGDFTQEVEGQPRSNWQVPYDERVLNDAGTAQVGDQFPSSIEGDGKDLRFAFFFHYLDFSKPLLSPAGPLGLPAETARPSRLRFFKYESPC
jgi:hypothetical protein